MYFFWSQECIVGVSDMCLKPLAGQVKSTGSALHGHLEPILPRMPFPGSYSFDDRVNHSIDYCYARLHLTECMHRRWCTMIESRSVPTWTDTQGVESLFTG